MRGPTRPAAGAAARIVITMTTPMVAVPIDTVQMLRLVEFASDVLELADERRDLELHELVSELHADLMVRAEDDD
jgi:hypothetical protein